MEVVRSRAALSLFLTLAISTVITKGNTGESNCDRLQEVLDEQSRLSNLLTEANRKITQLETDTCLLKYYDKCFWIELRLMPQMTFDDGKQVCADRGGRPANIYSEDHYRLITGYLRVFAGGTAPASAWIGMTYNNQTGSVDLTDISSETPYLKWYPRNPRRDENFCCNIVLRVSAFAASPYQHMATAPPDSSHEAVVCER